MNARPICEVVIVGAGPYGLSIAAHLAARGVAHRIFGQPMLTWQKMPPSTFLKSLGFATDIYLPGRRNNFVEYCRERGADEPPLDFATIESGITLRKIAVSLPALLRPWRFSKLDFRFLLYRLRDFRFMLGGPRTGLGART